MLVKLLQGLSTISPAPIKSCSSLCLRQFLPAKIESMSFIYALCSTRWHIKGGMCIFYVDLRIGHWMWSALICAVRSFHIEQCWEGIKWNSLSVHYDRPLLQWFRLTITITVLLLDPHKACMFHLFVPPCTLFIRLFFVFIMLLLANML